MTGGFVAWMVKKRLPEKQYKEKNLAGILFASGLVAGGALVGVAVAFMIGGWGGYADFYDAHQELTGSLTGSLGPWLALIMFGLLTLTLARLAFRGVRR